MIIEQDKSVKLSDFNQNLDFHVDPDVFARFGVAAQQALSEMIEQPYPFESVLSPIRKDVFGLQYGQNINPELLDQVTAKFFLMGPYRSKSLMRQIKRLEKEYNTPTIDSGLAPRLEAKEKCLYTKLAISQLNRYKAAKRRKARQQRK